MKAGWTIVWLLLGTGMAQADPDWCQALFDAAPAELESMPVLERTERDDSRPGFAVTYAASHPLTVEFFDAGLDAITEDAVENSFFLAARDVVSLNKELEHRPTGKPTFHRQAPESGPGPIIYRMDLSSESDSAAVINDTLFLFGWGDCMVKLHLSDRLAEKQTSVEKAQSLVDSLIDALPERP